MPRLEMELPSPAALLAPNYIKGRLLSQLQLFETQV